MTLGGHLLSTKKLTILWCYDYATNHSMNLSPTELLLELPTYWELKIGIFIYHSIPLKQILQKKRNILQRMCNSYLGSLKGLSKDYWSRKRLFLEHNFNVVTQYINWRSSAHVFPSRGLCAELNSWHTGKLCGIYDEYKLYRSRNWFVTLGAPYSIYLNLNTAEWKTL